MDPGVRCHGMKANPIGYLWSKFECFLITGCQDIKKTLTKCDGNGNGNTYDRGDYNSSFALRAVELKSKPSRKNCLEIAKQIATLKFPKFVLNAELRMT